MREENQAFKQMPFVVEAVRERPAVLGDEVFDFFVEFFCREKPVFLKDLMDQIEKCVIYKVLCMTRGNQRQAAMTMGIKYTTLNEKVKKYGIRFQKTPVENIF